MTDLTRARKIHVLKEPIPYSSPVQTKLRGDGRLFWLLDEIVRDNWYIHQVLWYGLNNYEDQDTSGRRRLNPADKADRWFFQFYRTALIGDAPGELPGIAIRFDYTTAIDHLTQAQKAAMPKLPTEPIIVIREAGPVALPSPVMMMQSKAWHARVGRMYAKYGAPSISRMTILFLEGMFNDYSTGHCPIISLTEEGSKLRLVTHWEGNVKNPVEITIDFQAQADDAAMAQFLRAPAQVAPPEPSEESRLDAALWLQRTDCDRAAEQIRTIDTRLAQGMPGLTKVVVANVIIGPLLGMATPWVFGLSRSPTAQAIAVLGLTLAMFALTGWQYRRWSGELYRQRRTCQITISEGNVRLNLYLHQLVTALHKRAPST